MFVDDCFRVTKKQRVCEKNNDDDVLKIWGKLAIKRSQISVQERTL